MLKGWDDPSCNVNVRRTYTVITLAHGDWLHSAKQAHSNPPPQKKMLQHASILSANFKRLHGLFLVPYLAHISSALQAWLLIYMYECVN